MRVKSHINYIFLLGLFVFVINKFLLRPWVLANDFPRFLKITVLSLPNFIEAIFGALLISYMLLLLRSKKIFSWPDNTVKIYFLAAFFTAMYVITQELKIHNLGGNNVYDPFDVVASIVGLIVFLTIAIKIGVVANS